MADSLDDLTSVPAESTRLLTRKEKYDYDQFRNHLAWWLLNYGINPEKGRGYAETTVKPRIYIIDKFYQWVWENKGGYQTVLSVGDAHDWFSDLIEADYSNSYKNSQAKAVKNLYFYFHHVYGTKLWQQPFRFREDAQNPPDYLTKEERRKIREASLVYGSIPEARTLPPDARENWKAYLAQRFEKPKEDITLADWERANSWKIASLVWVSMDTGLRPVEVERAVVSWADTQNGVLRIPKTQSSKNRENWVVALSDRTADYLGRWLRERENICLYDDSEKIWLTREGNPYQSASLRYVLHRLCETAGIEYDDRRMSWYTIRHSVGTYMTREEDLAATAAQLRHRSILSTTIYDQAPVEDRRDALDRMG